MRPSEEAARRTPAAGFAAGGWCAFGGVFISPGLRNKHTSAALRGAEQRGTHSLRRWWGDPGTLRRAALVKSPAGFAGDSGYGVFDVSRLLPQPLVYSRRLGKRVLRNVFRCCYVWAWLRRKQQGGNRRTLPRSPLALIGAFQEQAESRQGSSRRARAATPRGARRDRAIGLRFWLRNCWMAMARSS